jgi:hypothetical protein
MMMEIEGRDRDHARRRPYELSSSSPSKPAAANRSLSARFLARMAGNSAKRETCSPSSHRSRAHSRTSMLTCVITRLLTMHEQLIKTYLHEAFASVFLVK